MGIWPDEKLNHLEAALRRQVSDFLRDVVIVVEDLEDLHKTAGDHDDYDGLLNYAEEGLTHTLAQVSGLMELVRQRQSAQAALQAEADVQAELEDERRSTRTIAGSPRV